MGSASTRATRGHSLKTCWGAGDCLRIRLFHYLLKTRGKYIRALKLSNGNEQWKKLLDHPSLGAPATSKNHIYVPGNAGLYGLSVKPKLALL